MKKIILVILMLSVKFSYSQDFSIYIADNRGNQNISYDYLLTNDSLIITGISDYAKTKVDYLRRKYTKEEVKSLKTFFKKFKLDSIKDNYFSDYSNFEYISADHFPRVIEIRFRIGERKAYTKLTNSYVVYLTDFFNEMDMLLPKEVTFQLKPADFAKSF
ncbi:MAG: hypothetical protein ABI772_08090 [Bacteroidota bacterium]